MSIHKGAAMSIHKGASVAPFERPPSAENDFEDFSSDAEKLSAILKNADVDRHKHNLSGDYSRFRKTCMLIPNLFAALFVAVVGFVVDTDVIKDHMQVGDISARTFLSLLVASMGFVILFLTLLSNHLDYASRAAFHNGAASDLEALGDRVRMYRVERLVDDPEGGENGSVDGGDTESGNSSDDDTAESDDGGGEQYGIVARRDGDKNRALIVPSLNDPAAKEKELLRTINSKNKRDVTLADAVVREKVAERRRFRDAGRDVIEFYGYHSTLHQIMLGCKSEVPMHISKFFDVMENRVELMSLGRMGVEGEGRMRKNQIVRLCANEIYNEISSFWAWPFFTPNVDRTIATSLKRVGQLLNMNHRDRVRCKMFPCFPYPRLCCKKKTSNNVFAIINEGIDQRELDMITAERDERVRIVNDHRARKLAGAEQVIEFGAITAAPDNPLLVADGSADDGGRGGDPHRGDGGRGESHRGDDRGRNQPQDRGAKYERMGERSRASVDPDEYRSEADNSYFNPDDVATLASRNQASAYNDMDGMMTLDGAGTVGDHTLEGQTGPPWWGGGRRDPEAGEQYPENYFGQDAATLESVQAGGNAAAAAEKKKKAKKDKKKKSKKDKKKKEKKKEKKEKKKKEKEKEKKKKESEYEDENSGSYGGGSYGSYVGGDDNEGSYGGSVGSITDDSGSDYGD